ncbi:cold shock domain-containing protein CG9705-like [Patiria miniata]|uniref:CSD domain-containing protein n=1 Tax=Patiria miniata TaxID=46514 RepID=A0A914AUD6_PATMI|nr:cold shock domain-containing protein CG9705-like [Patiria miniata]
MSTSPGGSSTDCGGDKTKAIGKDGIFLIPSPIITRRTRTTSMSKAAAEGDFKHGTVLEFSKSKGHGFIKPDKEGTTQHLFVHVSDIEGDYVPQAGDRVTYKEFPLPPQNVQVQAVHVQITEMAKGHQHHRWEDPETS